MLARAWRFKSSRGHVVTGGRSAALPGAERSRQRDRLSFRPQRPEPDGEWADLPEWITTEEAAELSGYSLQYVQRLARQGHLGAQKKSRAWWVDRDRFVGYLEAMRARDDRRAGPRGNLEPDDKIRVGVEE